MASILSGPQSVNSVPPKYSGLSTGWINLYALDQDDDHACGNLSELDFFQLCSSLDLNDYDDGKQFFTWWLSTQTIS